MPGERFGLWACLWGGWTVVSRTAVAVLGGSCSYGSGAGLFDWHVNNTSSNSNWNIGSHLVCVL